MRILIAINLIIVTFVTNLFSQKSHVLESLQTEILQLIHQAKYSVVTISAKSSHSFIINKEGPFSFLKNDREEKEDNLWTVGSGIIYNEDGYIITRSSILADFDEIKVTLCDETECEAEYIGTDEKTGLAILKIDGKNLGPIRKGNSDEIPLYSMVLVLGNSMGISPFASFGLINGYTRDGKFILSTPINPGNIGGPVFNLKGEIIGIITAQLDTDVLMLGPSFLDYSHPAGIAIPINQVCLRTEEIIKMHLTQKNWLGIQFDPDSLKKDKLILKNVIPGSPAARVGLKKGDQLIKYNETDLANIQIVGNLIEQTKPGTSVSINFIRNSRPLKVFPLIERKWPKGFNPHKPRHLLPSLINENIDMSIQFPVILSPERFQQINSRMIQMENEIRSLKSHLEKYQ